MSEALDHVPIIDIGAYLRGDPDARAAIPREVDRINREIGFLVLKGHGFDLQLLADWFAISKQFFERPLDAKLAFKSAPGVREGYHPPAMSGLAAKEGKSAPPDLREYFMVGPAGNRWPDMPAGFREVGTRYFEAMTKLGQQLMGLFALALGMPESHFDDKIDAHTSVVSSIYYGAQHAPPLPGQLRAGAHTDYGALTILAPTEAPGGLQVRTLAGAWVDVPFVAEAFIINLGDMMQRWTNERWLSNFHRVVNPPAASLATPKPRQSVAYFLHPNDAAVIAAIPTCVDADRPQLHPAILAGEYMRQKEGAIEAATPTTP